MLGVVHVVGSKSGLALGGPLESHNGGAWLGRAKPWPHE